MKRVIKNNARIGKPWLVVEGRYASADLRTAKGSRGKWRTTFQLSEHNSKSEATAALKGAA